jgi:SAM-dependent methyltransferase
MKLPWFRHHFLLRRRLDRLFLDLPDAASRRLNGRSDWPPYSLRSFVGGARGFDRVGAFFLDELWRLGLFCRATRILDVGCGCGRIARALAQDRRLQELEIRYTGMDIDRACIEWCRRHITPVNHRFSFYHADCSNFSYNPSGSSSTGTFVFPHPDASFDLILLTSVMTHLLERDMVHYLAEVSRMLAPGGVAYASFFLYESLELAASGAARHGIAFPFRMGNAAVNRQDYPSNAVAYNEPFVRRAAEELGLEIIEPTHYGVQDLLLLCKATGTWIPPQLMFGWHELEDGYWRWTERVFAVRLERGSLTMTTLRFRFCLPAAIMDQHKRVRLTAQAGDMRLPSADYDAPGEHLYICEIPQHLWTKGSVLVQFELDKAGPPVPPDLRELGLQVLFGDCSGPLKRRLEPFVLTDESHGQR